MDNENLDSVEIRRHVEERLKEHKRRQRYWIFALHLICFIVFSLMAWGFGTRDPLYKLAMSTSGSDLSALLVIPTVAWGIVVLMHFAMLFNESERADKRLRAQFLREEIDERTMNRIMEQADASESFSEKPKRHENVDAVSEVGAVRLSDDGELVPIESESASAAQHINGKGSAL